jgi:hypothetical protein
MSKTYKPGSGPVAATHPPATLRAFVAPVSYRWSLPDGTVCHGSSVVLSRSKAGLPKAMREFWRRHTHVAPEND